MADKPDSVESIAGAFPIASGGFLAPTDWVQVATVVTMVLIGVGLILVPLVCLAAGL